MNERSVSPTQFISCLVTVTHGEKPGTYNVSTEPNVLLVGAPNTVIAYQIGPGSVADIRFTGMREKPAHSHQLSRPTIATDGQVLSFIDANTVQESLDVWLEFEDGLGNPLAHDPQILNEPRR